MEIININDVSLKTKNAYIQECLDIYNYYIENCTFTFETVKLTIEQFSERVENFKEKGFIVAVEDNKVYGYAYLDKFSSRQAYYPSVDVSLYVDKDSRGKNIGGSLIEAIENIAKQKGYKNIISLVTSQNEKSIRFHEKHGYEKCGYLDDIAEKFGISLGIYYYKKKI